MDVGPLSRDGLCFLLIPTLPKRSNRPTLPACAVGGNIWFPSSPRSSGGVSSSPRHSRVGLCFAGKGPSREGGWKLRAKADNAARYRSHPRQLALLCTAPRRGAARHKALLLASVISWGWLLSGEAGDGKRAACSASAAFVVVAAWGKLGFQRPQGWLLRGGLLVPSPWEKRGHPASASQGRRDLCHEKQI